MRAAAGLLVLVLLSGCLQPYRAHVPGDVVAASPYAWTVAVGPVEGHGPFGTRSIETLYAYNPGAGPPFPATMQVFSVRDWDRRSVEELLAEVERLVEQEAQAPRANIRLDHGHDAEGERRLANGMATAWFIREGTVRGGSELFREESRVRILGEVGHDGISGTSVVVVAMAQIDRVTRPLGAPLERVQDYRTWTELVGDPSGSVGGAVDQEGFVYRLRTHD